MLAFLTGSVYGLFAGALIKTMTGSEGGTPVPPATPEGTISTSTTTSSVPGKRAVPATPADPPAQVQIVGAVETRSDDAPKS